MTMHGLIGSLIMHAAGMGQVGAVHAARKAVWIGARGLGAFDPCLPEGSIRHHVPYSGDAIQILL